MGGGMSAHRERGSDNRQDEQNQSDIKDVSRRKAFARFASYAAPAMLALLVSETGASASTTVVTSDIQLKRDITRVGRLPNGLGVYSYRYLLTDTVYVGVLAQEVASVAPNAVVEGADGYLRVDYGQLGLRLQTWSEWSAAA